MEDKLKEIIVAILSIKKKMFDVDDIDASIKAKGIQVEGFYRNKVIERLVDSEVLLLKGTTFQRNPLYRKK